MRVGITINTTWNIYNFRRGLIKTLIDEGHDVYAFSPVDEYVQKLTSLGCKYVCVEMSASGINPLKESGIIHRYRQVLKTHKIDILLSYTIKPNIYGTLAARSLNIPVLANVSGLGTVFLWKGWVSAFARRFYHFALKQSAHIFFQNQQDLLDFTELMPISKEKMSVIPGSGINLDEYSPAPYDPGDYTVFLMTARLLIEKGVQEYVLAAEKMKRKYANVQFKLIGGRDENHRRAISHEALQAWIEAGIIEYTEHSDDIPTHVAKADAVVLPSYREGTSRTLLEGGALGRTLIATRVPGCDYTVEDGLSGFLCDPKSSDALFVAMETFHNLSAQDKRKMAQRSRQHIENKFDERIVINNYLRKIQDHTLNE
ncbi:MAG: glycosyltransferase family 4 protein [Cyclobacteriaceae bacterium]